MYPSYSGALATPLYQTAAKCTVSMTEMQGNPTNPKRIEDKKVGKANPE